MEAAVSLMLFSAAVIALQPPPAKSLSDLYVLQKENDLLKIWVKEAKFEIPEMEKDFLFVFPDSRGFVSIDGKTFEAGVPDNAWKCGDFVVSEAFFLNENLKKTVLRVGVCIDGAA